MSSTSTTSADAGSADAIEESEEPGRLHRLRAVLKRVLASFLMMAVIGGILVAVAWSRTRAALRSQLSFVGRDMLLQQMLEHQKEDAVDDEERVLIMNGQPFEIGLGVEEKTLEQVQAENPDCLPSEDGSLACLNDVSARGLGGMLQGDFSGLANLEYRMYRPADGEGSFYFQLKPGEDFDIEALLPSMEHDVEGPEHDHVPRPPDSVRVMSAYERGRPYLVSMFLDREGRSRETLMQWYRDRMSRDHWVELPLEQVAQERELDAEGDAPLWYHRPDRPDQFLVITFSEALEDEKEGTVTTILEAQ